jgi:very-short-patch-repair endonuclease
VRKRGAFGLLPAVRGEEVFFYTDLREVVVPTFHRPIAPLAKSRACAMLAEPTETEKALWRLLRDRRVASLKWRRQLPLGDFIVDFVCLEYRVIVECDGSQHAESGYDSERDAWLRSQGFTIVRFWNHEILQERANVVDTILSRCGLPW